MFTRLLRLSLSTLGLTSAGLGLLSLLPRLSSRTWRTQMLLNEFPGLPAAFGGAIGAAGWRFHSPVAFTLGSIGSGMSALPLLKVKQAIEGMDAEMRAALGRDYESAIQPAALARCQRTHWSARRTLNAHQIRRYSVEVTSNVVYAERPSRPLKLDIYRPRLPLTPNPSPSGRGESITALKPHSQLEGEGDLRSKEFQQPLLPAVIVLHPGAWSGGDKSWLFTPHDMALASKGYVVFDIQYRFVEETRWPGQLDDCREAIRWVRSNAAQYGVDPSRIALMGRSSGGHIALSTAYRATGEHADTAVSAVVSFYAPANLTMIGETVDPRVYALMGGDIIDMPERYYDASPVNFVSHESPPTLLIHGQKDGLAFAINSEQLRWRLRASGVPVALLRLPWAHHVFDGLPSGLGAQLVQYDIDRFLAWSLYHEH